MNTEQVIFETRDRLEIADALYRFAAGIDFNRAALSESACAVDAVVDFGPAALGQSKIALSQAIARNTTQAPPYLHLQSGSSFSVCRTTTESRLY